VKKFDYALWYLGIACVAGVVLWALGFVGGA
jgi:hypothetical protein